MPCHVKRESLRHNELRNIIALMLKTICKDVVIVEPPLLPLTGEDLHEVSAITGDEARLDVRARGFWQTNPLAKRHVSVLARSASKLMNERKKEHTTKGF